MAFSIRLLSICRFPSRKYSDSISQGVYARPSHFLSGSAVSSKARYNGTVSEANLIAKTWYNYDGNGNVLWTVKYTAGLGYKTMDYTYDDLGNVTKSIYQKGTAAETLVHYFEYDKNNRLVSTYTNTTDNATTKVLHAKYSYYLHGPLKRIELGDKLQGLDYVYGIDGKLKSINNANAAKDPGSDGGSNGFAADVFGMNFEYHSGDYSNTAIGLPSMQTNITAANYNGNINGISWFSRKPSSADVAPVMNTFAYDAIGQLTENRWGTPNFTGSAFVSANEINREKGLTYDGHGNIKTLQRTASAGTVTNNFTYNYQANTNKLTSVTGYANYTYDGIGQLASQVKGSAGMYLDYDVSGKVTKIYSNAAKSTVMLSFVYDDDGNRIQKKDHRSNAVTYYSYDGGGTLVAIFEQQGTGPIQLTEQPIYGADRLGTLFRQANNYHYTITDHVGNTRVVINRNKLAGGAADIVYYADYYPFGSEVRSGGTDSRYGYQGLYAEKDKETGWNNFELRNYDSAIGRWLTTDPYGQYHSPYVGMGNNPVSGNDPDGGWNQDGDPPNKIFPNGFVNRLKEVFVNAPVRIPKVPVISAPTVTVPRGTSPNVITEALFIFQLFSSAHVPQPYPIGYENKNLEKTNNEFINKVRKSPAFDNFNKDVDGSYTITWAGGTKYHGKGGMKRMIESVIYRTLELHKMGVPLKDQMILKMDWSPSPNEREAFKAEYRRMQSDAVPIRYDEGYKNPINLNQRQSPGKLYIIQDGF